MVVNRYGGDGPAANDSGVFSAKIPFVTRNEHKLWYMVSFVPKGTKLKQQSYFSRFVILGLIRSFRYSLDQRFCMGAAFGDRAKIVVHGVPAGLSGATVGYGTVVIASLLELGHSFGY